MKIKCSKVNLLNSLNIVSKAVSTKTTLPILECILIDVYADSIKLTANDLEIGIETILDGEVIEMGRIAIEAKLFNDIVRKLPNSEIFIETTPDYNTIIRCEKQSLSFHPNLVRTLQNFLRLRRKRVLNFPSFL